MTPDDPSCAPDSGLATLLNPLWSERRTLVTRHTPAECRARLIGRASLWLAPRTWLGAPEERPVLGRVSRRGFTLSPSETSINRWHSEVAGRFVPTDRGTRIELRFRLTPWLVVFEAFWLLVWLSPLALALHRAWLGAPPVDGEVVWPLFGALLLTGLHVHGRWAARGDQDVLVDFLRQTLQASEPDASDPALSPLELEISPTV